MSVLKTGVSLRSLVLTPERVPTFIIPSPRPLRSTPLFHRGSADRVRLLSDCDDGEESAGSPHGPTRMPAASPRFRLHLPSPAFCRSRLTKTEEAADQDLGAKSLTHIPKVTTPYGFRGVLAASPRTDRRESLFHRHKPRVTVTDEAARAAVTPPPAAAAAEKSRVSLGPLRALKEQVMNELRKPGVALRALSPSARGTSTS